MGLLFYEEAGDIIIGHSTIVEENLCNGTARKEPMLECNIYKFFVEYLCYCLHYQPGSRKLRVLQASSRSICRVIREETIQYGTTV